MKYFVVLPGIVLQRVVVDSMVSSIHYPWNRWGTFISSSRVPSFWDKLKGVIVVQNFVKLFKLRDSSKELHGTTFFSSWRCLNGVLYIAYRSTVYELRTTFPCPLAPRDLKHIDRALNEGSHFTNESSLNSSPRSRYCSFRRDCIIFYCWFHILRLIPFL